MKTKTSRKSAPTAKPTTKGKAPLLGQHPTPAAKLDPKPAPTKESKKERSREIIPSDAKLTVLAKENPRRGGLAAKTFALYSKAKTIGEFRELCKERGGDAGYLHADLRAGHIKIS